MAKTRVEIVQESLRAFLTSTPPPGVPRLGDDAPLAPGSSLTARQARELWVDQAASRLLDVAARVLRRINQSFYTISSAGHEQNAVLGALLRLDDPCLLHYRSGALMMARARKIPGLDPILDTVRSFCASADDPIAQGRHKVWGSRPLWVPPQTSTIASHLPKAYGLAYSIRRAHRLGIQNGLAADSIVLCSFGDASVNHAAALAGINAARYAVRRGGAAPVLFVCEDNGLGISVETPPDWIRDTFSSLPHLAYFAAAGALEDVWSAAEAAINHCRRARRAGRSFTCPRCGSGATPAPTWSPLTAPRRRSKPPRRSIRFCSNARRLVEAGAASPTELLGRARWAAAPRQ